MKTEKPRTHDDGNLIPKICVGIALVGFVLVLVAAAIGHDVDSSAMDKDIKNTLSPNRDYLILVNEKHPYKFNGEYDKALKDDLVYPPDVYGEATPLEKATFKAFSKLQQDLADKGMLIGLLSGYRTKEDQQALVDSQSGTNKVLAPGCSEHHTGLIASVLIWHQEPEDKKPIWYTETAERQAKIPEFKLLHETLADYGFIDRYPLGKEKITGIESEPYEIRFVGSAEVAHIIMDNGLVLEEYLEAE